MTEVSTLPDGVFVASLTPLHADLSINHDALEAHCRHLLDNGCNGLAILGTTGEANSFSVSERMTLLDRLMEAGLPAWRLLVGTGCCAIPDTIQLTSHALQCQVGGMLMLPPFYYKNVSDDGVFAAFDRVIQDVGDPQLHIYLYHIPQISGVGISHQVIERLLTRYPETIAGVKDSSGNWKHMQSLRRHFPSLRVYAGTELYLLDILRIGGVGCISASANVTFPLAVRVYAGRNRAEADALQNQLTRDRLTIDTYPVIPTLKALLALQNQDPTWQTVRPPLVSSDPETAAVLRGKLSALK